MSGLRTYLLFRLDDLQLALSLTAVDRVLRAVEVTPVPNSPDFMMGVIDLEGLVIPVLSLRKCLGRSQKELEPNDQLLVARTDTRTVALVIDEAQTVIDLPTEQIIETERLVAGLDQFHGVVQYEDGLVLIQDLERLLTSDQAQAVTIALAAVGAS